MKGCCIIKNHVSIYSVDQLVDDLINYDLLINSIGGYVYILESDHAIKIGRSKNINQRIKSLRTLLGINEKLVAVSPLCVNYGDIENAMHQQFLSKRNIGEWFYVDFMTAVHALQSIVSDPPKPKKKWMSTMRLDKTAHSKAKIIARKEERNLNSQLEYWIKKSIEQYEQEKGPVVLEDK